MTILIVAKSSCILEKLSAELKTIYPQANIEARTDPLMAGKYSFEHNVDMLIAEPTMKRMNGVQLIDFVRCEHPGIPAYLISTEADSVDATDGAIGIIAFPFTADSIKSQLK